MQIGWNKTGERRIAFVVLAVLLLLAANISIPKFTEAAVVFVGSSTANGTNSTYNLSLTGLSGGLGGSARTGDFVLVVNGITTTGGSDVVNAGVSTAGFIEILEQFSNDTNAANQATSYKIMGTTPDSSVTCNASNAAANPSVCYALVFRGVDQYNPLDATSTAASGINAEDVNCGAITPVTIGALVICTGFGAGTNQDTVTTWPAGWVQAASSSRDSTTMGAAYGVYSTTTWPGRNAVDPVAFASDFGTNTANAWTALTLVLRPDISRKIRVFGGFKLELINGKIRLFRR